ncbi:MAG: rhodanese-like domain-containing protein [Planctomycetota bacterium]|jgi:rhodanese-related sulfurtransferase
MKKAERNTEPSARRTVAIVLAIALTGGLTPLILYWTCYGRVPRVAPATAKELLKTVESHAILIDIKSSEEFSAVHIDGAQNWPLEEILSLKSLNEVPERFKNKTLLLISGSGMAGSSATKHLIGIGLENVKNVRGGVQEWIGSVDGPEGDVFDRYKSISGETWSFPFHHSPWHEQLLTVVSAFGIKPTYTLLSLILIIILWRSRSPDLAALRWSMICFFVGENFCAANYIFFRDTSYLFEYFHSFGMLLSFAFATYALLEGIDRRILMLSDPDRKCAALSLCRKCIKYENVSCGLKWAFFIIIPALAIVAVMPLCGDWHKTSYNTMIFGTFYHYTRRLIYQQFEMQYCPIAAIALLSVSLLILTLKRENPLPLAKIFFAAGVGPLGFGMFRSILTAMYSQDLVWFAFWEESTELLFIMGVCFLLWIFRHQLFQKPLI